MPFLPEGVVSLVWAPEVVAEWGGEERWLGVPVCGEEEEREEEEEEEEPVQRPT